RAPTSWPCSMPSAATRRRRTRCAGWPGSGGRAPAAAQPSTPPPRSAAEREAIAVLRAEWAWLSAPDRVRALVAANAEALGLEPMTAGSYVAADRLPSPPPESFWVRAEPHVFHPDPDAPDPDAVAAGPAQTERTP
ncbi:MAG: hypothetical protein ACK4WC_13000, partial [Rubrimonas sp.]